MSSKFCSNCGAKLTNDVLFCSNCGAKQKGTTSATGEEVNTPLQPPQYTQAPTSQGFPQHAYPKQSSPQQAYPPQGYDGSPFHLNRKQYSRPSNYVFTKSISERIIGTLKRDIHVIEEIEEREDLQDEANKLLITCFSLIALFQIIYYSAIAETENLGAEILYVLLSRFVGGYSFIYLLAYVGKAIGGSETQTDTNEIIRVTSYAYVARVIDESLFTLTELNNALALLWLIAFIYSALVFITVIGRALDRGLGTAIFTILLAGIGYSAVNAVFLILLF